MADDGFYYITKYALTRGIIKVPRDKARIAKGDGKDPTKYLTSKGARMMVKGYFWVGPKDWHETLEEAHVHVERMKERKRSSLEGSLKKLKGMTKVVDWEGLAQ